MTSEDPNIATLRRCFADQYMPDNSDEAMALEGVAAALTERDRRIAEQHALILDLKVALSHNTDELIRAGKRIRALEAPPAPAPGELADHDVCWHCKDCLEPAGPPHCESCPAFGDCTDPDCEEEACAAAALNGGDDNG